MLDKDVEIGNTAQAFNPAVVLVRRWSIHQGCDIRSPGIPPGSSCLVNMHKRENAMTEPSRLSPSSTFVIRFWHEWTANKARWRGRVVHVQSNQSADFMELESMLDFVRGFGIMEEDRINKGRTVGKSRRKD